MEIIASLRYEKLFGFCKECFRLTHDTSRCPTLNKEEHVQFIGGSTETERGNATSYKAAVTNNNRQVEERSGGQQGRHQGARGGEKGKGVARNRQVPYKYEEPYHPYREKLPRGNCEGSSYGRNAGYGDRRKGSQTWEPQQS